MMMTTSNHGITQQLILEEFGKRGVATQETVQKLLQNLVSLSYDVDSFGAKDNWLTLQYESLNAEKVLPELVSIYTETNQKIRELSSNPQNKGTEVV